jgi:hypothetical protein
MFSHSKADTIYSGDWPIEYRCRSGTAALWLCMPACATPQKPVVYDCRTGKTGVPIEIRISAHGEQCGEIVAIYRLWRTRLFSRCM